jgi:hypothetical protein
MQYQAMVEQRKLQLALTQHKLHLPTQELVSFERFVPVISGKAP